MTSSDSLMQSGTQLFVARSHNEFATYLLAANISQSFNLSESAISDQKRNLFALNLVDESVSHVNPLLIPSNVIPPYVANDTDCNDPPCDQLIGFSYFIVAPELLDEWVLFGDVSKIVSLSAVMIGRPVVLGETSFSAPILSSMTVSLWNTRTMRMHVYACKKGSTLICKKTKCDC